MSGARGWYHTWHEVEACLNAHVRECISHHVSAQVDAEDGDGAQGQRHAGDDEEQEGCDLRDVTGKRVRNRLLQVIENQATWNMAKEGD